MNRDIQPERDHNDSPDLQIMYRAMVQKKAKKPANHKAIEFWNSLSDEDREIRRSRLEQLSLAMIKFHPEYRSFRTATVTIENNVCKIHWNGTDYELMSGLCMTEKEFPAYDTPAIIKKYSDKLRSRKIEEEL